MAAVPRSLSRNAATGSSSRRWNPGNASWCRKFLRDYPDYSVAKAIEAFRAGGIVKSPGERPRRGFFSFQGYDVGISNSSDIRSCFVLVWLGNKPVQRNVTR
jgi:hypothetical protein